MKKITFLLALFSATSIVRAQGLQAVVVEKYYSTNAADSAFAASNGAATTLHEGSVTYRVFLDMAPGYKFVQMFGNGNHPLVIKTSTDFYNDPNNGQAIGPQGNSLNNTKQGTTLIDSYLTVGGVCSGKMGVLKTEDNDGAIGNSSSVLTNTLGGVFGVAINSIVAGAQDGLLPGTPLAPTSLGIGTAGSASDVFDQTPGGTCSCTNCAVSGLGGVVGVTSSNMVLIGQFTTNGILTFSMNVQVTPTANPTNSEIYVPNNAQAGESNFPSLSYTSATGGINVGLESGFAVSDTPQIFIYPNPTKEVFSVGVNIGKATHLSDISVYDVTGRLVTTKRIDKTASAFTESMDISDLKSGLYFVSVSLDGLTTSRRLVKD